MVTDDVDLKHYQVNFRISDEEEYKLFRDVCDIPRIFYFEFKNEEEYIRTSRLRSTIDVIYPNNIDRCDEYIITYRICSIDDANLLNDIIRDFDLIPSEKTKEIDSLIENYKKLKNS